MPNTTVFSNLDADDLGALEAELAYFYGAPEPQSVATHYLDALKMLETLGIQTPHDDLKAAMTPSLEKAYHSVKTQTPLHFDTRKAAQLECELILAQTRKESFDTVKDIMVRIYETVFHVTSPLILKAAMLRTFLYQYKIQLINSGIPLTLGDRDLLINMARESENLLNSLCEEGSP